MKTYKEALLEFRHRYFSKLLVVSDGSTIKAAEIARLSRQQVWLSLRELGISTSQERRKK